MKKYNVATIFLGVLFLAIVGTVKMYGQFNTFNYFVKVQGTYAIPSHIDPNMLTDADKAEMEEEGEYEFEYCEENNDNLWLWDLGSIFDMDKATRLIIIEDFLGYQVISDQDSIVEAVIEIEEYNEKRELTIKLNELIIEMRYIIEDDDNLFFDTTGNYLWGVYRINFKRTKEGYVIPEKETDIGYDETSPGEIPYETTDIRLYLYYEIIDDEGNTLSKTGNKTLFDDCMGYTSVKEIQQNTNITVFPNPTTGKIVVSGQLSDVSVEIYDIVGRNVGAYCIRPESNETTIDISHLSNGMYFLKVDNKTVKIVKE